MTFLQRCALLASTGIFVVIGGLAAQATDGVVQYQPQDGDPNLCGDISNGKEHTAHGGISIEQRIINRLTIVTECRRLPAVTLPETPVKAAQALAEWEKEIFSKNRLPRQIFAYRLVIENDRDQDIEVNLGNWDFTHSPYVWMAKGFSYRIPACSKYKLGFLSPWPPLGREVNINVGYEHIDDGQSTRPSGWTTSGNGTTFAPVPSWYQYAPGKIVVEPLSLIERKSEGCINKK